MQLQFLGKNQITQNLSNFFFHPLENQSRLIYGRGIFSLNPLNQSPVTRETNTHQHLLLKRAIEINKPIKNWVFFRMVCCNIKGIL